MNKVIVGVILAGGQSRRMGGGDKSLASFAGHTLIDHVIGRFATQCARILISANGDPSRFAAANLPVIGDLDGNHAGPLAGILAAMHWARREMPETTHIASVTADAPLIPYDLVARLALEATDQSKEIAVARSAGQIHPPIALWPVNLHTSLEHYLMEEKQSRVAGFLAIHTTAEVEWPSEPYDPFFNINTPEDMARANALVSGGLVKD